MPDISFPALRLQQSLPLTLQRVELRLRLGIALSFRVRLELRPVVFASCKRFREAFRLILQAGFALHGRDC